MGAAPSREAVLRIGKTCPAALHCASALQVGLANLDEHAVAALGFGHLVFVRSAPAILGARSAQGLQRMADAMLLQFSAMIAATHRCAPASSHSWWWHWRSSCPTARRAPLWLRPSWCGRPRNRPTRPGWWRPGLRMKR